jgi:hypothetical protein
MKEAPLSANQNAADSAIVMKENAMQLCDWWARYYFTEVEK